jgi:tetratricopeptide (TPR) repeat protein
MACRRLVLTVLCAFALGGGLLGASGGDPRGELIKAPPVRVAVSHTALLPQRLKPRIAFLQVSQNPTTRSLVDQAIAILTRKGFDVLEREDIAKVVKEQAFNGADLVDLDQQVQLGKIMGVTDLVIVNADFSLKVSFKAIDITSAKVLRLVKDSYPDQKNAAKALAGFFTDWQESYDLMLTPCTALEAGDYESLADTYQVVLDAYRSPAKLDALAQLSGGRVNSGSKYVYKAGGSSVFQVKAWAKEPEDSPKRSAYLVYEAYLEHQLGLLFLREERLDAALGHLQQADSKLDKAAWQTDECDKMAKDIQLATRVVQRLKAEKEMDE